MPLSSDTRALIIDDSLSSLGNIKELIESISDIACATYDNPAAALQAAESAAFDFVLVDYDMPGMDGIEVVRRLRLVPQYSAVPIVMITSSMVETVRFAAIDAGTTDFLSKTAEVNELKMRLRNMIRLSVAFRRINDQASWLSRTVHVVMQRLLDREEELILRLSRAVEYRDSDTGGHTLRVAGYSRILAEKLGLPAETCRSIYLAAPLHDVGKVGIPDAILLKPGRLDESEVEIIKSHAEIGAQILAGSQSELVRLSAEIASSHHERWDGTGYPSKLKGCLIPLAGRIVAVADVFDALTTSRPYKQAMPVDEAFDYIERERGKHFDPRCVDAFIAGRQNVLEIMQRYSDRLLSCPLS